MAPGGSALGERIELKAGPLSMVFEPAEGFLRYVKWGDTEVLRGIYAAVRDRNWGTVAPQISQVELVEENGGFALTFAVCNQEGEIDFSWQGAITGTARGEVSFSFHGEAITDFMSSRIGFCVLHPVSCAGAPCRVTQVDGSVQEDGFPEMISPHQPFMNMRKIAHQVAPESWFEVGFEGDIFEMEDQRNWTDASYKTYCRPLELSFPFAVKKGDEFVQEIRLRSSGAAVAIGTGVEETTIEVGRQNYDLPKLGLGVASDGDALSAAEVARLKALKLHHLRVDLHLSGTAWRAELERASGEARALGAVLEAAVILGDEAAEQLAQLAAAAAEIEAPIGHWLIFHQDEKSTGSQWIELARQHLVGSIGAGTDCFFTELNRQRPSLEGLDLVSYSVNPQVHAFDDASLVETLAAQPLTAHSARAFCRDLPLWVSPVTLKMRFNPNATGPAPAPPEGELPDPVDMRQLSLFGAVWTVGSIKHLATGAVAGVTYYETVGWRGLMERATGSPLPEKFPSVPGSVFPLYHVFSAVADFVGGQVVEAISSDGLAAEALVLDKDGRRRLLVANMQAGRQTMRVRDDRLPSQVRVCYLDEGTQGEAGRDPEFFCAGAGERLECEGGILRLELAAHGVALVDY
ncbi:MAG: hypothetical protein GKR89_21555 [Candidatus Latescibacteria bacterium]|nr:hypothetical protein [Candidatus Latescibacterota bacterium]